MDFDIRSNISLSSPVTFATVICVGGLHNLPAAGDDLSPAEALLQFKKQKEKRQRISQFRQQLKQVRTKQPAISKASIQQLQEAIDKYRSIVSAGGWPKVETDIVLHRGVRHPAVPALRQRLIISGDLAGTHNSDSLRFDDQLQVAVQHFQVRHGLKADAVVGKTTLVSINTPARVRLQQLELNLTRISKILQELPERYVFVNVPAAEIELVSDGVVESRHTAVVGKIDRQTPILQSSIYELNFNPYWTVPRSIIRRDLIPIMRKDPEYLAKNEIKILTWGGRPVDPADIDWTSDEDALRFNFRQEPGAKNSLGTVRINFENDFQVYLHDTPSRQFFSTDNRFHSSGCVRVGSVDKFVDWLIKDDPNWDPEKVDQILASKIREDAALENPVALRLAYITSWATKNSITHFRDDIYRRDGLTTARILASAQL